jgi:hypothetical protein
LEGKQIFDGWVNNEGCKKKFGGGLRPDFFPGHFKPNNRYGPDSLRAIYNSNFGHKED